MKKYLAFIMTLLMTLPIALAPLAIAAQITDQNNNPIGEAWIYDIAGNFDIDGEGALELVLFDGANSVTYTSDNAVLNATAQFPYTIYILVEAPAGTNFAGVTISWDANRLPVESTIAFYEVWGDKKADPNTGSIYYDGTVLTGQTSTITIDENDIATISLPAVSGGRALLVNFQIDQPAPGETPITINVDLDGDGVADGSATLTLTFDNGSPTAEPVILFADGNFYQYSTATYYAPYDAANDTVTVYLKLSDTLGTDPQGNPIPADLSMYKLTITGLTASTDNTTLTINLVDTADTVTNVTSIANGYEIKTGASATEAYIKIEITGFVANNIAVQDGTVVDLSFNLADQAGNTSQITLSFTVDITAPTVLVDTVSRGATPDIYQDINGNYWLNTGDTTITLSLAVSDWSTIFGLVEVTGDYTDTGGTVNNIPTSYLVATISPDPATITTPAPANTINYTVTVTLDFSAFIANASQINITINVYDEAGNMESAILRFMVDSVAPQFVSTGAANFQDGQIYVLDLTDVNIQPLLTFTFSDDNDFYTDAGGQPLVEVTYEYTGAQGQPVTVTLTAGTDFTATIDPQGNLTVDLSAYAASVQPGSGTFKITVYDIGANSLTYAFNFFNDTQAPNVNVTGAPPYVSVDMGGAYVLKASIQASDDYKLGTLTVEIATTGITIAKIEVFDTQGDPVNTFDFTANPVTTAEIPLNTASIDYMLYIYIAGYNGGPVDVSFKVTDTFADLAAQAAITLANVHSTSQRVTFNPDTNPPSITFDDLQQDPATGVWSGYVNFTTLTITVSDAESGVNAGAITVEVYKLDPATNTYTLLAAGTDYQATFSATTGFVASVTITLDLQAAGEGQYKIVVTASDAAGNTETGTADPVYVDLTRPVLQASAITLPGTIKVAIASLSDDVALAGATITLTAGGTTLTIDVNNATLLADQSRIHIWATGGGLNPYHLGTQDVNEAYSAIGQFYKASINNGQPVLVVVAYKGVLYVYPGYVTEETQITLEIEVNDMAGNMSAFTFNGTVLPGFTALLGLERGWNLISFPVVLTAAIQSYGINNYLEATFSDANAYIKAVYYYQPGQGWQATTFTPTATGGFTVTGTNIPLNHEKGFWVYVESGNAVLTVRGYIPHTPMGDRPAEPLVYVLQQGHNFVGFTSLASMRVGDYFASIANDPDVYGFVYVFNNELKKWEVYSIDSTQDDLVPGQAVWVYAYSAGPTVIVPVWYSP